MVAPALEEGPGGEGGVDLDPPAGDKGLQPAAQGGADPLPLVAPVDIEPVQIRRIHVQVGEAQEPLSILRHQSGVGQEGAAPGAAVGASRPGLQLPAGVVSGVDGVHGVLEQGQHPLQILRLVGPDLHRDTLLLKERPAPAGGHGGGHDTFCRDTGHQSLP